MAFIYHIITPDGIYVGQDSSDFHDIDWLRNTIQDKVVQPNRVWQHLHNAYVKNNSADNAAESIKKRGMDAIKQILIFDEADNYGIPEECFNAFKQEWITTGRRAGGTKNPSQLWSDNIKIRKEEEQARRNALETLENKDTVHIQKRLGNRKRFETAVKKIRERTLSPEEKLDIAEILHIYNQHGKRILNRSMGGQSSGWVYIGANNISISNRNKILNRNLTPSAAYSILSTIDQEQAAHITALQKMLNQSIQQYFTEEGFWKKAYTAILKRNLIPLFLNGKSSYQAKTKQIKTIVLKVIENFENDFIDSLCADFYYYINNRKLSNAKKDIKDAMRKSVKCVVNLDGIAQWFTSVLYNHLHSTVERVLKGKHAEYAKDKNLRGQLNEQIKSIIPLEDIIKTDKGRPKIFQLNIGKGIDVNTVNQVFYNSTPTPHNAWAMSLFGGKDITDQVQDYAIIVFTHLYKTTTEPQQYGGYLTGYNNYALIHYNHPQTLKDILHARYIEGGMSPKAPFLNEYWTESYNILVKMAQFKLGKEIVFLKEETQKSKEDTTYVISNYMVSIPADMAEETIPFSQAYICMHMPTEEWNKIKNAQSFPIELKHY